MKTTLRELLEKDACKSGIENLVRDEVDQFYDGEWNIEEMGKVFDMDKVILLHECTDNTISDLTWAIQKTQDETEAKKLLVTFSVWCAESVIDVFEKRYPEDDRPRKAIEAAKTYLNDMTEKNRQAARAAAAYAADAAA
jgi:predicted DNA binding protein